MLNLQNSFNDLDSFVVILGIISFILFVILFFALISIIRISNYLKSISETLKEVKNGTNSVSCEPRSDRSE